MRSRNTLISRPSRSIASHCALTMLSQKVRDKKEVLVDHQLLLHSRATGIDEVERQHIDGRDDNDREQQQPAILQKFLFGEVTRYEVVHIKVHQHCIEAHIHQPFAHIAPPVYLGAIDEQ